MGRLETNLEKIPIRFRLTRGSYFSFLGTLVTVTGNFTISVILARLLGSEGLGIYTIYTVLGVVFIPLLSLSIPSAVAKFTAELRNRDKNHLVSILSTAVAVLMAGGVAGAAILFLVVAPLIGGVYDEPLLVPMVRILAAFVMANLVALFAGAILQGLEEFQSASLVGGLSILANVPLLLLLLPSFGPLGAALAGAATALANAGLATWVASKALRRHQIAWRGRPSRADARTLVAFVGPLNAASVIARASIFVQTTLVAVYVGFRGLGLLRVAGVFYNAILFFPRTLLSPMIPVLTSMVVSRPANRSREILTQLVKLALLLVVPLAGGLILGLPAAIAILYGTEFLPALPFAAVLSVAAIFAFPNIILGEQYLIATGRTMNGLLVTGYSAATGLGLTVALLPAIGAMALPLASLLSESTLFAILIAWLNRGGELSVRPLAPALGYTLLAVPAALLLNSLLPPGTGIVLAMPFAASLAALGFFVLMDRGERNLLAGTIRGAVSGLRRQGA